MSGFALLHRSLLGHHAFRNDAEAMTFAWMILRASWKPARVRYKGKAITLQRGQLAVSVRDLADAMDRDKAWIERLFKRLKAETMIETHTETGVSVVTICNYAQYQAPSEIGKAPNETPKETRARQARDTEQQDKQPEQETSSEAKASSTKSVRVEKYPRPDFADPDDWSDFLGNRKKKHLNNSGSAHAKLLRDVAHWSRETGWPPGVVFRACVENGWAGIYDPRTGNNGRGNQTFGGNAGGRDRRDGLTRALDRELGLDPPERYSAGGTGTGGGNPVARLAAMR